MKKNQKINQGRFYGEPHTILKTMSSASEASRQPLIATEQEIIDEFKSS